MELRAKCSIVNYNNAKFNNMFSNQVINAYYYANQGTDIRILRNKTPLKIMQFNSNEPENVLKTTITSDDEGFFSKDKNSHLFK